jgi:hypothetical protein
LSLFAALRLPRDSLRLFHEEKVAKKIPNPTKQKNHLPPFSEFKNISSTGQSQPIWPHPKKTLFKRAKYTNNSSTYLIMAEIVNRANQPTLA